jgi:hypothetical protein
MRGGGGGGGSGFVGRVELTSGDVLNGGIVRETVVTGHEKMAIP